MRAATRPSAWQGRDGVCQARGKCFKVPDSSRHPPQSQEPRRARRRGPRLAGTGWQEMAGWKASVPLGLGLHPVGSKELLMPGGNRPQLGPLLQGTPDHGESNLLLILSRGARGPSRDLSPLPSRPSTVCSDKSILNTQLWAPREIPPNSSLRRLLSGWHTVRGPCPRRCPAHEPSVGSPTAGKGQLLGRDGAAQPPPGLSCRPSEHQPLPVPSAKLTARGLAERKDPHVTSERVHPDHVAGEKPRFGESPRSRR